MKKIYLLGLLLPFVASCNQEDGIGKTNDSPIVENVKITMDALPAHNEEGDVETRAWSGNTTNWEAPQTPNHYEFGNSDRVGLAHLGGWSGDDASHGGKYYGDPFRSKPYSYTFVAALDDAVAGDDAKVIDWYVAGQLNVGEYVAYYPYVNVTTSSNIIFDISSQTLKNKKSQVAQDGCLFISNGQIGFDEGGTSLNVRVSLVPVTSLLQLRLDMGEFKNSEITKVEVANVGTGFTYLPQADKAFGFSSEPRASQKKATQLISEGYAENYKNGTITLNGSVKADEDGYLEIYFCYFPVTTSTLKQPTVTLYAKNGDVYQVKKLVRDMTTYNGGENLTKFNSGLKMGFSATSPAMEIVKIN